MTISSDSNRIKTKTRLLLFLIKQNIFQKLRINSIWDDILQNPCYTNITAILYFINI